jgi:hypothetical protein
VKVDGYLLVMDTKILDSIQRYCLIFRWGLIWRLVTLRIGATKLQSQLFQQTQCVPPDRAWTTICIGQKRLPHSFQTKPPKKHGTNDMDDITTAVREQSRAREVLSHPLILAAQICCIERD